MYVCMCARKADRPIEIETDRKTGNRQTDSQTENEREGRDLLRWRDAKHVVEGNTSVSTSQLLSLTFPWQPLSPQHEPSSLLDPLVTVGKKRVQVCPVAVQGVGIRAVTMGTDSAVHGKYVTVSLE